MPYGTVSKETRSLIGDERLVKCERGQWRVDVIVSGALDESFNVSSFKVAGEIVKIIAASLAAHKNLKPTEHFEVSLYDDYDEPPVCLEYIAGRRLTDDQLVAAAQDASGY